MDSHVPYILTTWLLDEEDRDDQLAMGAMIYRGMARYDERLCQSVRAETDWIILQLIHCSDL